MIRRTGRTLHVTKSFLQFRAIIVAAYLAFPLQGFVNQSQCRDNDKRGTRRLFGRVCHHGVEFPANSPPESACSPSSNDCRLGSPFQGRYLEQTAIGYKSRSRTIVLLRRTVVCAVGLIAGVVAAGSTRAALAFAPDISPVTRLLSQSQRLAPLASAAFFLGLLSLPLRPLGLARPLLVAATRCITQLSLLGGLVLSSLFRYNSAQTVLPYISILALVAALESASRVRYETPRFKADALAALAFGCGTTLAIATLGILRPNPWYDAGTVIPLGGMLFGNAVSALALCANSLFGDLRESVDRVELLLARGATAGEASLPSTQGAVRTALTPTLNSLSVCGLVHIPGVMTGSILSGMKPGEAGRSQAIVMMLIASSAVGTVLAATSLLLRDVLDFGGHRVLTERIRLAEEESGKMKTASAFDRLKQLVPGSELLPSQRPNDSDYCIQDVGSGASKQLVRPIPAGPPLPGANNSATSESSKFPLEESLFVAKSLSIPRANISVSFELKKGEKLAVLGKSGVGKTQLLRRLALLEKDTTHSHGEIIMFNGNEAPGLKGVCTWRRHVSWVPQHRPTLFGTPQGLYEDVTRLRTQRAAKHKQHPVDVASSWGLDSSVFSRSWSSLSGGEAQRASLAIALSLQPDVMLLDEPTCACDAETTRSMEKTLDEFCSRGGRTIIVTHSREQAERFCTHILEL
uniref:ABC transporter domain-containing protein n=1 Tax=Odontella aurita TaxID=265563 RepID=A0A7S4MNE5_9STRA|mmetsp:Transcript_26747/g.79014  ORF Transcript_26747/g.79014 Transcript_26747/m.79014 type:complete len:691 (+) Transcript_26747:2-2074(+)